jgi:hypothetical protein
MRTSSNRAAGIESIGTMRPAAFLQRHCAWLNPSAASLIALLQRSPAPPISATAGAFIEALPVGVLIRSAAVAAAALGCIDSMAGATTLVTSLNPNSNGTLPPFEADVGVAITPLAFTIAPLITIGSWKITGTVPPGLTLTTVQPNGGTITGPVGGFLDATSATNTLTTPILVGTPTEAGSYVINMQGFWYGGESGGPTGKGISSIFPFTVVVSDTVPSFLSQPISVTVAGGTVAFDAVAQNASSYQWMLNGSTPVPGGTDPILLLSDAAAATGSYTCVASNDVGSATSNPATVTVTSTNDIGRLINISTRGQADTGSSVLIAGFVVGPQGVSGTESLLIRASGPALTSLGVPGALPDPQLQLFNSANMVLDTNNGWAGNTAIAATAATVGAFPWTNPASHDAALAKTLPAGNYTAQIFGQSGDTGVALAEVYDATPKGTYSPNLPRLTNISSRVWVGTDANIVIAGFVIGGSTARTVLIRASGPALVPFGVAGTLPDPQLQLLSGATAFESGRGWGGAPEIASAAGSVGAFPWNDAASLDSALLITLPPGPYTAQVSSASGSTGVALVEVYEVP